VLDVVLYTACLVTLMLVVARACRAARALDASATLTACLIAAALIYLSWLLPGGLGLLRPWSVTVTLVILSLAARRALGRAPSVAPGPMRPLRKTLAEAFSGTWSDAALLMAFAGLVGLSPLLLLLARMPRALFDPQRALPMDVVSCHLPALVEFVQAGSLWTMKGPFSGYSFAYELIAGLPALFFRNHAGLLPAHLFSIAFFLAALVVLTLRLVRASGKAGVSSAAICLLSCGAWGALFRNEVAEVGKNDIFQGACVLAALVFALDALASRTENEALRPSALSLLSATALGLAIGTKPTALAYVPLFVTLWAIATLRQYDHTESTRTRGFLRLLLCLVALALFGGFFLLRNLVAYGSISDPTLSFAWKLSLAANLRNPALYMLRPASAIFLASLLTPVALTYLWRGAPPNGGRNAFFGVVIAFFLVGLCAFAVTPHGVFRAGRQYAVWRLRLAMPLFALGCAVFAVAAGHVAGRWFRPGTPLFRLLLPIGFLAVGLAAPLCWRRSPMSGLPGYERIYELPQTDIYRWVQEIEEPQRIYAAGLRPYGLYGRRWQHTLFYDLYSTVLKPEYGGRERLAAVLARFKPDLILISIDPNSFTPNFEKPLVDWVRQQDCFEEVFNDRTASAFRVCGDCRALIERYARDAPKLRMMGEIHSPGPWRPPGEE